MANLVLDVTIEIPKGSKIKYEYNRATKQISVDRILYGSSGYPQNYGFLKEALDWDGDELDCLVIADQSIGTGISVPTRVIGAMEMIDDGETDTKLIGVIDCDPRYTHIKSLKDLNQHLLAEIKDFFENYKNLQHKKVIVRGFQDQAWAVKEYKECCALMKKYGKMPKAAFINKMKKAHPNKYR